MKVTAFLIVFAATLLLLTGSSRLKADSLPRRDRAAGYETALPMPISRVRAEGDWTLYSRLVNQINCYDAPADGAAGETWVGTGMGLKRLAENGALLRLYSRADGLPGDDVLALVVEPKEVWCIVAEEFTRGKYGLCRLDRATDHWETLREVPIPRNLPGSEQTNAPNFLVASEGAVCFVLGNIARSADTAAFVWDRQRKVLQEARWAAGKHRSKPTWAVAWHDSTGDSLLLPTSDGLGQYHVQTGTWTWPLPKQAVSGGAQTSDGALWLAIWTRTVQTGLSGLRLSRFDPASGAVLEEHAQPAGPPDPNGVSLPDDLVATRDALWLVSQRRSGFWRAQLPVPTVVARFDRKTQVWQNIDAAAPESKTLPQAVLGAALLSGAEVSPDALTGHFLGWTSPAETLPVEPEPLYRDDSQTRLPDSDGAAWTVDGRKVLVRAPGNGGSPERFPLPPQTLAMTPQAYSVAVVNDTLFAVTHDGFWQGGLPGDWKLLLPVADASRFPLYAAEGQLWTLAYGLRRYDPQTGQYAEAKINFSGDGMDPLSIDSGFLWLTDRRAAPSLYRVPLQGGTPELVPYQPQQDAFRDADLVGVVAGKVWYSSQFEGVRTGYTVVTGYSFAAKTWTPPLLIEGYVSNLSLHATHDGIYLTAGRRNSRGPGTKTLVGDTYRYDLQARRWGLAAPAPFKPGDQERDRPAKLRLVSVDAQSLWLANGREIGLWRWDRARRVWTYFAAPGAGYTEDIDQSETFAARHGNLFFVCSASGLWRFDSARKTWARMPMPGRADRDLLLYPPMSVDDKAVWTTGAISGSSQAVAVRFDKATHTWRFWGEESGFPDHHAPGVDGDGVSALATTYLFGVYHLNPHTDHWDNLSADLTRTLTGGQPNISLFAREAVGDPPYVWLRTSGDWYSSPFRESGSLPPVPPLARWDSTRNAFQAFAPPPSQARPEDLRLWGEGLCVEKEAIWFANLHGLWRFLKEPQTWQRFDTPADLPTPQEGSMSKIKRGSDGAIWLFGRDTLLRWASPASSEAGNTPKRRE